MNLLDFSAHQPEPSEKQETKSNEAKQQKGPERLIKKRTGKRALLFPGIQKILKR